MWKQLAERKERGFRWKQEVLVQIKYVDWEEFSEALVVPETYRSNILKVAQEKLGNLAGERVLGMIKRRVVWPGMA